MSFKKLYENEIVLETAKRRYAYMPDIFKTNTHLAV